MDNSFLTLNWAVNCAIPYIMSIVRTTIIYSARVGIRNKEIAKAEVKTVQTPIFTMLFDFTFFTLDRR